MAFSQSHRVSRTLVVVVVAYVTAFVALRLSSLGDPSTRAVIFDAAFVPAGLATTASFWLAGRRCAGDRRSSSAWRWLAIALLLLTAASAATVLYQAVRGAVPFPSVADACYLSFYVVFFAALLRFPTSRKAGLDTLRLSLDLSIVALSATCVIWFLVLGPTVSASGQQVLTGLVSGAYPVGDLLQVFALTYIVTRGLAPNTRMPLRILAVLIVLNASADILQGWLLVHGSWPASATVQILWITAYGFCIVAGASQSPTVAREADPAALEATYPAGRDWATALPYLAPAVVFGLLIEAQFRAAFFERVSVTVGATLVGALVLARQFVARRDLLAVQTELSYRALHDVLTALPNRALVLDRAEQMLARGRFYGSPSAALFIDIDGFKGINDSFGHAAGDELLATVAKRLNAAVRGSDTVGRFGGDEFVVIFDATHPSASPSLAAERILDGLQQPIVLAASEQTIVLSVSIGISIGQYATADGLLRDADLALYAAKAAGKNRYVIFEPPVEEAQAASDLPAHVVSTRTPSVG